MNAVLIRAADTQDRYPVKYAGGNKMNENLSELPADVRNLQIHVTDIKAEVRATNAKIDSLNEKVERYRDERNQKIESLSEKIDSRFEKVEQNRVEDNRKIEARFDKIDDRFRRIDDRFEEARKETKAEFAAVRAEMQAGFKEVRERDHHLQGQIIGLAKDLSKAQVWAWGLYFAGIVVLVGMMAHGFKWV